jgi:hypothetical protein
MRLKYTYILPIICLLFFLAKTYFSEISTYPFHESNALLDISLSIIAFISMIINLPSNLIFSLIFGKMPHSTIIPMGVSLIIYFLSGISLDFYKSLPKK